MNSESKIYESFESAEIFGINYNSNQQTVKCPSDECRARKKSNAKTLSINIQQGVFNCHHCEFSGKVKDQNFTMIPKKEYLYPKENNSLLGEFWINWFATRGIEKRVIEYFKLGEFTHKGKKWVTFPYYRDKKLINNKNRSEEKGFSLTAGAELIFWNIDAIKGLKEVVVVEGEIDCMSLYQSSIFNGLSVPNGASKGSMKLEYLDNCWQAFENVEKIILFTDNDEPGLALRDELARRLGRDRCWVVDYPEGCKDANDILVKLGTEKVNQTVKLSKPFPIEDISTPSDYLEEVLEYHRNGFPEGDKIGYSSFDNLLSFRPGEMTIITGIPNSGKSAFLDQILIRLSSRHGWKHGVLSREQWPHAIHVTKLTQIFSGKGLRSKEMTEKIIRQSNQFLNEHFVLFGIKDLTVKGILAKAKQLVLQRGIKSLVVDPWNTLTHDKNGFGTETEYINEVLKAFVEFKDLYGVHIFLVAHPKKIMKDGTGENKKFAVPEMYDISGSSHFFNMTDNGISVYRNLGTRSQKANPLGDTVTAHIQKVRNFFIGQQGSTTFDFNYMTGNYAEEYMGFENEIDLWLFNQNKQNTPPQQVIFSQEKPNLTDLNKLDITTAFDYEPNVGIPPF